MSLCSIKENKLIPKMHAQLHNGMKVFLKVYYFFLHLPFFKGRYFSFYNYISYCWYLRIKKKVAVKLIYSNDAIFFKTSPNLDKKDWNYRIILVAKWSQRVSQSWHDIRSTPNFKFQREFQWIIFWIFHNVWALEFISPYCELE